MSLSQNLSKNSYTYQETLQELESLLTGQWITDLANVSALLMDRVPDINWVGFYLVDVNQAEVLWLGPFQGKPACTQIAFGKGVCGTAALKKQSIVVKNVDEFPGHIVCDSRSKSEVVIPIIKNDLAIGVLDVDSASLNRFNEADLKFFEAVINILIKRY